jgi:patatin-like phospholipase/acyl hydrolase
MKRKWSLELYRVIYIISLTDDEEEAQRVLDTPVWEYVQGSSSAPSFFPSYNKVCSSSCNSHSLAVCHR